MKIERDTLEPQWRTGKDYARAQMPTGIQLRVDGNGHNCGFAWRVVSPNYHDIAFGDCATLELAQSAAFDAYLNLIFH